MRPPTQQQIQLFRTVFAGREEVFAVYWEKGTKRGFTPAFQYDPYLYRKHKMGGGTFQNYPDKTFLPLTDSQIAKHLNGGHLIGVYPLLKDNTSWFLAADFDGEHWENECRSFLEICRQFEIPAYLERSRSGKGGHVWIFFEEPYPALNSRQVFIYLLKQANVLSLFDKDSSFDRLFPNQDFLSGKGLGNLIALPLYKPAWEQGNSCFVDLNTLNPIPDQWHFLATLARVPLDTLNKVRTNIQNSTHAGFPKSLPGKVSITLANDVRISKHILTETLVNFLKEEFNIANSEFYIKQKSGRSTWNTPRLFRLFEESDREVILPRGGIGKIIRYCREQNLEVTFSDQRKKLTPIAYTFQTELRHNQRLAVENTSKKDFGVIVAPPGSGKTVMGLKIVAEKQQPALILVHRKQLLEQWKERVVAFLGIPKHEIGTIGLGKMKPGKKITVATIQSLSKALRKAEAKDLSRAFGTILIDECHHIPAATFRDTIDRLHCYYLYGLTATPFRKYSDGKLIFLYLGEVVAEINPAPDGPSKVRIIIRETDLEVPFNPKTDKFEILSKIVVHDAVRNQLIVNDICKEIRAGNRVVVLTERREHIEVLAHFLKPYGEVIMLSGEDPDAARKAKWKILQDGNFQVLITTGQFFGEGTDLQNIGCLFLTYPFSFEGKLIQYIGRVQRGELLPVIYDYHDRKVDYLHRLFLKRNVYYRKIVHQATLFDEPQDEPKSEKTIIIKETLKIPIEQLEFCYGAVAFSWLLQKEGIDLRFEIENNHIRPELEVLKPYFVKVFGAKQIKVSIFAEIEHGEVRAQTAFSNDLALINREVIDFVKFRFVEKNLLGRKVEIPKGNGLLNVTQLQELQNISPNLFESGEELMSVLLRQATYKHSRQLHYLADRHERSILKLRFVLSPFSFLFLLVGEEQYHLILETLDTEEATYIWHFEKNDVQSRAGLSRVENDLHVIRQHGRQYFLTTQPVHFHRVVHDYSEAKKGFMIWKDGVEELLR